MSQSNDWSNLSESSRDSRNIIILRATWSKYRKAKQDNDVAAMVELQAKIHELQGKLNLPKSNFLKSEILSTDKLEVQNFWKQGRCSACGAPGIFWNGGNKTEHFCHKCDPLIIVEKKK